MMAELAQKLRQTFGFSENHIQAVIYEYRQVSQRVNITGELHVIADDPSDDVFIECAIAAGASLVASGDHHLLDLNEYEGVQIVSAADFVARFSHSAESES